MPATQDKTMQGVGGRQGGVEWGDGLDRMGRLWGKEKNVLDLGRGVFDGSGDHQRLTPSCTQPTFAGL